MSSGVDPRKAGPPAALAEARRLWSGRRFREMLAAAAAGRAGAPDARASLDELRVRHQLSVCLADFDDAARTGELLLLRSRAAEDLAALRRGVFGPDWEFASAPVWYRRRAFSAASRAARAKGSGLWGAFYLLCLSRAANRALPAPALRRVAGASSRYAWMRWETGQNLFSRGRMEEAAREFLAAGRSASPPDWKSLCQAGEVLFLAGREADALRAFRSARSGGRKSDLAAVLAWEGEILLWAGRYRRALAVLDRAAKGGALYAAGWKAGALVKLGRPAEALRVLDAAPTDLPYPDAEAMVWRAEALYRLGRFKEAADWSGRALSGGPPQAAVSSYALALRALAAKAAGNLPRFRGDYARVKPRVIARARDVSGIDGRTDAERAEILEAVLQLSRGVRRDGYELAAWMKG